MKSLVVAIAFLSLGWPAWGQSTNPPGPNAQPVSSQPANPSTPPGTSVQPGGQKQPQSTLPPVHSDTPRWVANGIALLNLSLVCYLAYFTHSSRRKERKDDLARAVGIFWFQDLILKPNIETLHAFFQKYEADLAPAAASPRAKDLKKQAQTRILAFKADYHSLRRKVVEPLEMVSQEFAPVGTVLSQIEDFVTGEYARIPGLTDGKASAAQKSAADQFRDLRQQFFRALHEGQKRLVTPS